jgi:hypothetical protein
LSNRNAEVDAENVGGVDAGGFQRVKSWQKQSKWESGKFLKYSLKFKCFKTMGGHVCKQTFEI